MRQFFLSFFIARRYLSSRKSEKFISIIGTLAFLGIMLGVSTLIIVTSVMNGFRDDLYKRILGMNGHLGVYAYGGENIKDYNEVKQTLEKIEGVKYVTPVVQSEILFTANDKSDGGFVKGVLPEDFVGREFLTAAFDGDVAEIFKKKQILIGQQMARFHGLVPGDIITLYSPFGITTAFGTLPRVQKVVIGGVFGFDMYEYDRNFIFMGLAQAQELFNKTARVSRIEVHTDTPDTAIDITLNVSNILPKELYGANWLQTNGSLYQAIEVERRVSFIVLTLVILIAALNIISAQIMLVKEKSKSIAILRSMGAGRGHILSVFAITGTFMGVSGTIIGGIIGVSVVKNIDFLRQLVEGFLSVSLFNQEVYHLEELPALLNYNQTFSTIITALSFTFLAALYPAWRAAKLNPVEILRYE
ncbi:MAG: lipoprotein-releasing ABC transporter permease subunit [Alphaproteobacteria bacterium]|nr:lipoprotein-releasing ABC transporter permease subunit [Alphaproteobacteria bacterium]